MEDKNDYIGNYRTVRKISNGAFGDVYLAQHSFLANRTVAIKVLQSVHIASQQERDRFFQEAQFLENLKHPYILPVMDVGVNEGSPYIVTEYASKGSLRDLLQRQSSSLLPVEDAVAILSQIGQALQHAHQQNVIHRDLKPENILFNSEGHAIIADFGIATVLKATTRQTNTAGTFHYMAPEQFRSTIAKESDQYALGCIAYELFTGRILFDASDYVTLMMKCLLEAPVALRHYNPELPLQIEEAVLKALAKERADRHTDIAAFVTAIQLTGNQKIISSTSNTDTINTDQRIYKHWMDIAIAHAKAKRYKDALAAYQQLILSGFKNADILCRKGNMLWYLEHFQEALETFKDSIELNDQYIYAHSGKGFALLSLHCNEEALEAFANAISIDKNYVDAYAGKGRALEALQRYQDALIAFENVPRSARCRCLR